MQSARAHRGDVIVVHGHTTGAAARTGVIVDVLGAPNHVHYRVRWDEEHDSLYWPGSDATIQPGSRRPRGAGARVERRAHTTESRSTSG